MSIEKVVPAQLWVILPLGTDIQRAFLAGDKVSVDTGSSFVQTSYFLLGNTQFPAVLINSDGSKINAITAKMAEELGIDQSQVRISAVKIETAKPVESGRIAPKVYG